MKMKTVEEYSDAAKCEISVNVDALLRAINKICESEVYRSLDDLECVNVDGHNHHT